MKIETKLNCGDKVWYFLEYHPAQITVGKIEYHLTDTPGLSDEADFIGNILSSDQGRRRFEIEERYMCIETGIGSGTIHTLGKSIFLTEQECIEANKERLHQAAIDEQLRRDREKKQLLNDLELTKKKLAALESRVRA